MRRGFLNVQGRQIHYRSGGNGPPVVLLHPSPLSSTAVLPMAQALEAHFRVYALDTPGYGGSEAPATRPASLDEYLPTLAATLDALGLDRICLYGAATGAQLGVEFAKRYPARVALLVLDSAGHFAPEMVSRVIDDYFPSLEPRRDGSHLMTVWTMVRDLGVFFPWCEASSQNRIQRDLAPPAALHAMLLDYLRAGARYDWAYRPAFYNERADRTRAVAVPAIIVRWSSSLLLPWTDALIGAGLPANFEVLEVGPGPQDRLQGIATRVRERYRGEAAPPAPPSPPSPARELPPGRFGSRLVEVDANALHLRIDARGSGRPLLLIHAAGSEAAVLEHELAALREPGSAPRPLLLLDLPGHGESGSPALPSRHVADFARIALAALAALGIGAVDAAGVGLGGLVALEMRLADAARIGHATLIDPPPADAGERDERLAADSEPCVPRTDGTHLFAGWNRVRDEALWSPWYRRTREAIVAGEPDIGADVLHRRLVGLMKAGEHAAAARRIAWQYEPAARLALAGDAASVLGAGTPAARRAALARLLAWAR